MCESKDLLRGLEGLRKLAGDVLCVNSLWDFLRCESKIDWGVSNISKGSLRDTLARLTDEIEAEAESERPAPTDAERRVLDMWPRFEDGEPVMPGDEFIDFTMCRKTVKSVEVRDGSTMLHIEDRNWVRYRVDERVKRPATEVLDADGAPIHVGDTVWHEDGTELRVTGFGDEEDGQVHLSVKRISGYTDWREVGNLRVTHARPDSWSRLFEDAGLAPCDYFERAHGAARGCCGSCPAERAESCNDAQEDDLVRRAKKLAGVVGE